MKCKAQDSDGNICNKEMTKKEKEQDGMCSFCADNIWVEMTTKDEYKWYHKDNTKGDKK